MALVKCPECAKEVSSAATACPNCGYPIASALKETTQGTPQPPQQEMKEDVPAKCNGVSTPLPETAPAQVPPTGANITKVVVPLVLIALLLLVGWICLTAGRNGGSGTGQSAFFAGFGNSIGGVYQAKWPGYFKGENSITYDLRSDGTCLWTSRLTSYASAEQMFNESNQGTWAQKDGKVVVMMDGKEFATFTPDGKDLRVFSQPSG